MRRVETFWFDLPVMMTRSLLIVGLAVLLSVAASAQEPVVGELSLVDPAAVGLSPERLERLDAGMQRMVDEGKVAGVVTMLTRDGHLAFVDAAGVQDVETGTPMSVDTIFQIYSMTKPVTGVAMMMLYEEGKWRLNDPVSKYIPEFEHLQVYVGESADGSRMLEPANRSMTLRELMTHSGGFDYGGDDPVGRLYDANNVRDEDEPLQLMIEKLSRLPLRSQPGTDFYYSISVDVQGYLVEKLSGQPFDEFLLTRIFEPLGMDDTAFFVPAGELDRAAQVHRRTASGQLVLAENRDVRTLPPTAAFGGHGLYSTAGDYVRFTQMLLNGGHLDGHRLLSPRSVEMMRTNQLLEEPLQTMQFGSGVGTGRGRGFGLDFSIVMDAAAAGDPLADGSFWWYGAAGTWFWIDPVSNLAFIGMIQNLGPTSGEIRGLSHNLVYQALVH
tara:strand:- start:5712 stop:7034 length:1323 start_codon:yes stop_codon:yes gene_type:complete